MSENKETRSENRSLQDRVRAYWEKIPGVSKQIVDKLVAKGIAPLAGGADQPQIEDSLQKVGPKIRKQAGKIGDALDAAILGGDQAKLGGLISELGELKNEHPELADFYALKVREASGEVKVGAKDQGVRQERKDLKPQALVSPEPLPSGLILPKRESQPAVCLSDLEKYRQVELPKKTVTLETEEGTAIIRDPDVMDINQATKAALGLLHRGVLSGHTFSNFDRTSIERYIDRVRELKGEKDESYKALHHLGQSIFNLQKIIYDVWEGKDGAKGSKHDGAKAMINGVSSFQDVDFHFLLQDPYIESAMHRVKGSVAEEFFVKGQDRGDLGKIFGGQYGAAEKVGYYLRMFSLLGGLDGAEEVRASSYTANVLLYPLEYFNKADQYNAFRGWIQGEKFDSEDEKREFLFTYDTKISPSAFHNRTMAKFLRDNFEPDKLGWKNIGRMLALLDGPDIRDPRRRLITKDVNGWEIIPLGIYTLAEFLRVDDQKQEEMAKAAWAIYQGLKKNDTDKDGMRIQERILKVNMIGAYYTRHITENGWSSWTRKPVLNFEEKDLQGNPFIDIGAFKTGEWGNNLSANFLNSFWTDFEYAYRTQDEIFDVLCQTNPKATEKWMTALQELLSANTGLRHLSESGGVFGEESERSLVELAYERQRIILHFWERYSRTIEASMWESRRHARDRLTWAESINKYLLYGYDIHRYRQEFEDCGIYNRDWTSVRTQEGALTDNEKIAKVLGKFERPDVWIVWLKEIGFVDLMKRAIPGGTSIPADWQELGIRDPHEYLAYLALVAFAGYRVKERGTSYREDLYNFQYKIPRVEFALNFGEEEEKEKRIRGHGLEWQQFLPVDPDYLPNDQDSSEEKETKKRQDQEHKKRVWKLICGFLQKKLNDPLSSPILEYYEKMQEEYFIDQLIEKYLQKTFDQNPSNWVQNRWGLHLKYKKRWDAWALIRRQMKYSVGQLSEKDYYVHDQVKVTGPILDKRIEVDKKGLPDIDYSMMSGDRLGWDHIASMSLGSAGIWRPKEELMTPPQENTPKEKELRSYEGMGDAGEETQLSWMPLYFNKYMMFNFFAARLLDVAYRYEQAKNAGEVWEQHQCYLSVADEEQRLEFFNGLELVLGEDHNWVEEMKSYHHIDETRVEEFRRAKANLMVRNIKGEAPTSHTEDELVNLQNRVFSVISQAKQIIPGFRSQSEALSFVTGTALGAGAVGALASAAGLFATIGGAIVAAPATLGVGIWFGSNLLDKGVDAKTGREKASGLAYLLGTRWVGNFALGMVGKRIMAREHTNIARGWEPVWDSAIPMDEILKLMNTYKSKLTPQGTTGK